MGCLGGSPRQSVGGQELALVPTAAFTDGFVPKKAGYDSQCTLLDHPRPQGLLRRAVEEGHRHLLPGGGATRSQEVGEAGNALGPHKGDLPGRAHPRVVRVLPLLLLPTSFH